VWTVLPGQQLEGVWLLVGVPFVVLAIFSFFPTFGVKEYE